MGNYYFATCNNTDGHYEDNRAQYFLEGYPTNPHLRQWAEAGVDRHPLRARRRRPINLLATASATGSPTRAAT